MNLITRLARPYWQTATMTLNHKNNLKYDCTNSIESAYTFIERLVHCIIQFHLARNTIFELLSIFPTMCRLVASLLRNHFKTARIENIVSPKIPVCSGGPLLTSMRLMCHLYAGNAECIYPSKYIFPISKNLLQMFFWIDSLEILLSLAKYQHI